MNSNRFYPQNHRKLLKALQNYFPVTKQVGWLNGEMIELIESGVKYYLHAAFACLPNHVTAGMMKELKGYIPAPT